MRHHTIQSPIILEPVAKTVSSTPITAVCDRLLVLAMQALRRHVICGFLCQTTHLSTGYQEPIRIHKNN